MEEDDFESLEEALEIFHQWGITEHTQYIEIKIAKESERLFDFETPLSIYLKYSLHEEAARIRKLQAEQGSVKVDQTVVQGDQITKTEIKDSVVSKSNVGRGSSKMQELKDLTEMKKEGLIDDDEFKQMKKEILGK